MWLWMCANKTHERSTKELIDGSGCSDGDYCSMRLDCTRKGSSVKGAKLTCLVVKQEDEKRPIEKELCSVGWPRG